MSQRFFVQTPIIGDSATLTDSEAHHLLHVMRAKVGAEVTLFDGTGYEFPARVEKLGRSEVELAVLSREQVNREPPIPITLAVALPKGDRQSWLVEKATELGVWRLIPLITERSVAQPVEKALGRLRKSVIEASKQCGRNRLMEIAEPVKWEELVVKCATDKFLPAIAHPGGMNLAKFGRLPRSTEDSTHDCIELRTILFAVGPEGGFTDEEVALADQHNWHRVGLGRGILRVETAALALAAWAANSLGK